MMIVAGQQINSCNCMYGTQDPRCCISKARQKQLDDAYAAGVRDAVWCGEEEDE